MSDKKKLNADELFAQALSALQSGKSLEGSDGVLTLLIKRLIEASLEGELDNHLDESRPNRRNGKTSKKVKTSQDNVEITTPSKRSLQLRL